MHLSHHPFLPALAALLLGAACAHAGEASALRAAAAGADAPTALQRAEQAAAANPKDVALRFALGVALMDHGQDAQALDLFTRLADEYPELPDPHNNIALLRARRGDYDAARLALEAALRNDPGHRAARANLGRVHLVLAVQAWEQLGAQGPLDPALQRQLDAARALLAGAAPRPGR